MPPSVGIQTFASRGISCRTSKESFRERSELLLEFRQYPVRDLIEARIGQSQRRAFVSVVVQNGNWKTDKMDLSKRLIITDVSKFQN
jgi:hypothetical protein